MPTCGLDDASSSFFFFLQGVTFPTMYVLISEWIPPRERPFLSVFIWSGKQAKQITVWFTFYYVTTFYRNPVWDLLGPSLKWILVRMAELAGRLLCHGYLWSPLVCFLCLLCHEQTESRQNYFDRKSFLLTRKCIHFHPKRAQAFQFD